MIVAIEDPAFGGRAGAWAVASGWVRYLRDTRGLRPGRIVTLRDERATAEAVARAMARIESSARAGAMLWVIVIGPGASPAAGGPGRLIGASGGAIEQAELLAAVGYGYHESSLLVLDACMESPPIGWRSGLPAVHPDRRGGADRRAGGDADDVVDVGGGGDPVASSVASIMGSVDATRRRVAADVARARSVRRNVFTLTAGTGEACGSTLDGRPWPALSWAALGALQGWADRDGDGLVSATDVAVYAQALLGADGRGVALEAAGADLGLALLVDTGPRPPEPARRRRSPEPIASERATMAADALARAESTLRLDVEAMAPVPAGAFTMGCADDRDDACEDDERPTRTVTLGPYAIDRDEVTWAEYRACVEAGACAPARLSSCHVWTGDAFVRGAPLPEDMLADDHPVVCVSWTDAAEYCAAVEKHLPTEAQWERAARGLDGRVYPWGDTSPNCARAAIEGCKGSTRSVGSTPLGDSPVGAHDMAGNVAEWVFDWWHEDTYRRRRSPLDPSGPAHGQVRGVRGGSFYNSGVDLRASYRYGLEPDARMSIVGFRCAR